MLTVHIFVNGFAMFKSYYCEKLEKELNFTLENIKFCCSYNAGVILNDIKKIKKLKNNK